MRSPVAFSPVLAATVLLTLAFAGCDQQAKRDTPVEKSATEKVQEAMAAKHAEEEKHRAEVRAAATEGKLPSINSVCPVTGEPVDPKIAPITVEIMVVNPPEILAIGVANEAAADAVRGDPGRYAAAAKHNRQARGATTVGR